MTIQFTFILGSLSHIQSIELRKEYSEFKERAVELRRQKQETEMSKETTIDDLTRGIINYKYLGLDFERIPEDKLR